MKKEKRNSKVLKFLSATIWHSSTPELKHSRTPNPFTMVEITMAIAIIGIGMAGVMALLPIGFNATRDAIGDNYSSNMADQFMHIIAMKAKNDWTTWISNTGSGGLIVDTKPSPDNLKNTSETAGTAAKGNLVFGNIYYGDGSDGSVHPGVFWVETGNGSIIDFQAVVAIWKSEPRIAVLDNVNFPSPGQWSHTYYTYNKAAALNMEISWPAGKPYTQREKRYYYLEIFAPK